MGAPENRDKSFGSLIQFQGGFISPKRGRKHGQQIRTDAPNTAENFGENRFIELADHDGQSHESI